MPLSLLIVRLLFRRVYDVRRPAKRAALSAALGAENGTI
jgi:hypothetical protein